MGVFVVAVVCGVNVVGVSVAVGAAARGRRTRIRELGPGLELGPELAGERGAVGEADKGSDEPLLPLPLLLIPLPLPPRLPILPLTSLPLAPGLVPPPPAAVRSTRDFSAAASRTAAVASEARARSWAWLSRAGRAAGRGVRRGEGGVGPSPDTPPSVAAGTPWIAYSEEVEAGAGLAVRRRLAYVGTRARACWSRDRARAEASPCASCEARRAPDRVGKARVGWVRGREI